ncbi:PT domain-containing protein [Nonomuraea sp. B12E4]|uniref:PT domain-containing protein n=1 Tax=Nonomuraea sp. B12E4 TaxID=3153564 RepID=UPI00325E52C0
MNRSRRNLLIAGLFAAVFVVAAFLIIRSAFDTGGSASGETTYGEPGPTGDGGTGEPTSGDGDDGGSNPDNPDDPDNPDNPDRGGATSPIKSLQVGGATVSNEYPIENFDGRFTDGSCAVLVNLSPAIPITVVSVGVGPPALFAEDPCQPQEGLTNVTSVGTCAQGVILPARGSGRPQGCAIGVKVLVQGDNKGAVTLVTRARCTTRDVPPCTLMASRRDVRPSEDSPVRLTVTQEIGFESRRGITDETPTGTPSSEPTDEPTDSPTDEPTDPPIDETSPEETPAATGDAQEQAPVDVPSG